MDHIYWVYLAQQRPGKDDKIAKYVFPFQSDPFVTPT